MPFAEEGVLKSSESARRCHQGNATSVSLAVLTIARGPSLWVVALVWYSPPPFFSREGALCFIWQGKREKESSPQSVHGQCCCKKTSFKLLSLRHPCEHTCTWNPPTVMPHRSLPSQVEGWHSVGLWRPVLRIPKTPAHNLWQSVVVGA